MKRIFLSLITVIAFSSCNNEKTQTEAVTTSNAVSANVTPTSNANAAAFKFEKESYDFGQITEGEKVSYEFAFTNTGKEPMIITGATATCGCTVPDYPHEPIGPGQSGKIGVVFNSSGKNGMQNKVISITANTVPAVTQLHLIGDVKSKSE